MINELLISKLCKQVGIDSVQYSPVKFKGRLGLVSKDFLREGEQELKMQYESITHALACLGAHKMLGMDVDLDEVERNLFKLILLDLFTLQSDRHSGNAVFIKNEKARKIKMAPIFDCEYAFNIDKFSFSKDCEKQVVQIFDDEGEFDVEAVIKTYDASMTDFDGGYYGFACLTAYPTQKNNRTFEERVKDCLLYAKDKPYLQPILKDFVEKIDVKSAFEQLKEEGVEVSPYYIKYTCSITNYVREEFAKNMQNGQNLQEKC